MNKDIFLGITPPVIRSWKIFISRDSDFPYKCIFAEIYNEIYCCNIYAAMLLALDEEKSSIPDVLFA